MQRVQMPMELLEPMEHPQVSRTSSLAARWSLGCLHIGVGGKLEELSFCGLSERPRNARIQKPNHGLQHAIRRERVTPVDAEGPPTKTEHHRLVRVGEDSLDITETARLQPIWKTIL